MDPTAAAPGVSRTGSPVAALDAVAEAARAERVAGVAKLEAVLAWALAHPGRPGDCASWDPALLAASGEDGVDRLGGEGTPAVAEFAVEQLATRLRVSSDSAMALVAEVLDLAYRHPIVWQRVRDGDCSPWTARRLARACTTLPADAAGWVDARVGHRVGSLAWRHVEAAVAYAVAQWDPTRTAAIEAQARDPRHVTIRLPGQDGLLTGASLPASIAAADIRGRLSTTDAIKFDALVAETAARLADHGDRTPLDVRRARALGVIADQLLTGELPDDVAADPADGPAMTATAGTGRSCLPATLFVHVDLADLASAAAGGAGVGTVERLGPASLGLIAQWLGQSDLTIRPVLDAGRRDATDAHDPPAWMRELVVQRDRHCAFPRCGRDARTCDLDHISPYVPPDQGGPPGQTRPGNLAPLCRRHHRAKTFTRWRYRRLPDGDYRWTDPAGHTVLAPI